MYKSITRILRLLTATNIYIIGDKISSLLHTTNKELTMSTTLKHFMSTEQRDKLKSAPTWHRNCIDLFGVARPGKTNKDRKNGLTERGKNVRVLDSKTKRFIRLRDGVFVS